MRRTIYHLSLGAALVSACADENGTTEAATTTSTSQPSTGADSEGGASEATPTTGDTGPDPTGDATAGEMTTGDDETTTGDLPDDPPTLLSPVDQLIRASMAIRGVRPTLAELEDVAVDPAKLESYVDEYLDDDLFLETVKDLYAEALLLRLKQNETSMLYSIDYAVGDPPHKLPALTDTEYLEMITEEPLEFISWVASDPQRPFTDILTSKQTVVSWVGATVFRVTGYDFSKQLTQPFQVVEWKDDPVDRPAAGLLAHTMLWRRHVSNGKNYQRGRAATISRVFLCEDLVKRDVPPFTGVDLSDDAAVTMALKTNDGCKSCHITLDPLANFLAGINTRGNAVIRGAYGHDKDVIKDLTCQKPDIEGCYPLITYKPNNEGTNEAKTGSVTGYLDTLRPDDEDAATWDVGKLGQFIADDPRFALCTARRFYSFMAQTTLEDLPFPVVKRYADAFVGDDQDFDLRRMVREIVLSPEFMVSHAATETGADAIVGLKTIRPEQLARTVEDLTGFVWRGTYAKNIGPQTGKFSLLGSDTFGYRTLAGGIDGRNVTLPTFTYTPTRTLTVQALAGEAAGYVVDRDLGEPDPMKRKLLALVEADEDAEAPVKQQIAALHRRVLGELVDEASTEVLDSYVLWQSGGPEPAQRWKLLLATMFQDHRIAFF